jgi:hypothetical protein
VAKHAPRPARLGGCGRHACGDAHTARRIRKTSSLLSTSAQAAQHTTAGHASGCSDGSAGGASAVAAARFPGAPTTPGKPGCADGPGPRFRRCPSCPPSMDMRACSASLSCNRETRAGACSPWAGNGAVRDSAVRVPWTIVAPSGQGAQPHWHVRQRELESTPPSVHLPEP